MAGTASTASREALSLGRTAVPIATVGLVNMGMSITDTLMMAHLDPRALAAGAVIGDVFSVTMQFCVGALGALAPSLAAAAAAGAQTDAGRTIAEGVRWAVLLGVSGAGLIALAPGALRALGLELPLQDATATYACYMAGTFALMMIVGLSRIVLPALGLGRVPLYVMAAAIPLNALADGALMYGWLGLPNMGLAGAGAASLLVAAIMAVTLLACLTLPQWMRDYKVAKYLFKPKLSLSLARAAALTGTTALSETGVFLSSTAIVGFVAIQAVPAHVAVFRTVAIAYVLGSGLAQAITIHVARGFAAASGLERPDVAHAARLCVLILGPTFFAFVLVGSRGMGALMGVEPQAIGPLAPWAALAVVSMVQTGTTYGFLRARLDVTKPAIISLLGYWGVGFTAMLGLAGAAGLGAIGIWMGLAFGSAATALGSWIYRQRGDRARQLAVAASVCSSASPGSVPWRLHRSQVQFGEVRRRNFLRRRVGVPADAVVTC